MDNEILSVEQKKEKNILRDFFDTVELLAIAASIILLVFTLIVRITVVNGSSMERTLFSGDKLIVSNLFYSPEQGDIVIIQSPAINHGEAIIKRVIAVGGDTVQLVRGAVYVNGELLPEADGSLGYTIAPEENVDIGSYHLAEDEIFVLGDNRSISYDSGDFGPIDRRAVLGKVLLRIAPFNVFGTVN